LSEVVFALYRPKSGKEKELEKLIERHAPLLRELELITNRPRLTLQSTDGTYIELIEWVNAESANKAHEHPAIANIWEAMEVICEFKKLADLKEANTAFAHLKVISHLSDSFT
jgi:hypothetical protein